MDQIVSDLRSAGAGPREAHNSCARRTAMFARRLVSFRTLTMALGGAAVLLSGALPLAQQPTVHLNPVIAKLAQGQTVYGLITGDLSLANARDVSRSPVDFIYADLEHNPLDFPAL